MTWDGHQHVTKAWGIWLGGPDRLGLIGVYHWTNDQPVWQDGYRLGAFRTRAAAKHALATMRESVGDLAVYANARVVRLTITTVADVQ